MKKIGQDINSALGGMKEALKKAEHLSSEHKMSILSQLQHRRGQIRESWDEAIKAYESEGKEKGLLAKKEKVSQAEAHMGQLSRQLEDLNHIKQYLETGDSLAGSSTLGKEGYVNADAHLIEKEIRLYGVFDGIGDKVGSDKASKAVVEFIKKEYAKAPKNLDLDDERELIKNVLVGGNEGIKRMKAKPEHKNLAEMGTTALLAKIRNDGTLTIANVGDCRALLIKKGTEDIKHLTLDNSYINGEMLCYKQRTREELLDRQKLIASSKDFTELSDLACKNLVKHRNALGIGSSLGSQIINPDIYDYKIERGDILILASDGTTDNLTDQEIMKEVKDNAWNPERAAEAVTNKAKDKSLKKEKRSKPDDITTLVIVY